MRPWRGVIAEYSARLPDIPAESVVTLGEGGTPLLPGSGALGADRLPGVPEDRGHEPDRARSRIAA